METNNYNSIDTMPVPEVPQEIKKWNWGAFMLNIIWGFGNKSYLPLLCLIPVFNFVWIFVCGAKGNQWAWKKGNYTYDDIDTFLAIQATWNRSGLVQFIIGIVFLVLYFILVASVFSALL